MESRTERSIALLVAGAFFMENLDGTIISTAAPSMARSLGVPSVSIGVTITAYLVTLAVLIPLSGWAADRWGARTIFTAAIAVFTIASVLCAISGTLLELSAMRVLQGVGGAMMVPVGRLVVLRSTAKKDLIRAVAYLTWPGLIAPVVAPVLGGVLVTYLSWRWIFLVNVPLGAIALVVAIRLMPNPRGAGRKRLDWLGVVLTSTGLALLVYDASLTEHDAVNWTLVVTGLAIGGGLTAIAIWHLLRAGDPLIDLRVFSIKTFRVSNAGGSVFRALVGAIPFLLPLMFQDAFGWSPIRAGVFVLFVFVGNVGIKPLTTPIMRRFGFRPTLIFSTAAVTASLLMCAALSATTPIVISLLALVFGGVFRSIGYTVYNSLAFADVGPAELNNANAVSATVAQLAAGIGVAAAAVALRIGDSLVSGHTAPYRVAFVILALLSLLPVIEAIRLHSASGSNLIYDKPS